MRKSPIRHHVCSHKRQGIFVHSFTRGHGEHSLIRTRRVVSSKRNILEFGEEEKNRLATVLTIANLGGWQTLDWASRNNFSVTQAHDRFMEDFSASVSEGIDPYDAFEKEKKGFRQDLKHMSDKDIYNTWKERIDQYKNLIFSKSSNRIVALNKSLGG